MSEAELLQLFLAASQALDSNFEFWITASFALLVASHFTNVKIPMPMFAIVLGLYISGSLLFTVRLYTMGRTVTSIRDQLESIGAETAIISAMENTLVAGLYFLVVLVGTVATALFVIAKYRILQETYR